MLLRSNFSPFPQYFFYLLLDSHVKAGTSFSLRDKRLFEISEVEIKGVNCMLFHQDNAPAHTSVIAMAAINDRL